MSLFVDLKRLFYGKDEVDTELNKKLEKPTLKNLNHSGIGVIFTNNQDDWLDITTENGSYTLSTQSSSPYDSTISLSNFKGTIRFKLKGNKGSMNLKTSALSDDLSYGEEGSVTNHFTETNTNVNIVLNPYSDFLINCSSSLTLDITYNASFWSPHMNNIADMIYPIGSIYMSCNNTSPMYLFGGRWEQIKDKFILSAGDTYANGSTGGEATHSLTQSEMPRHTHTQNAHYHRPSTTSMDFLASNTNIAINATQRSFPSTGSSMYEVYASSAGGINEYNQTESVTATNKYTGGTGSSESASNGSAHNNMPPYLTVYMWKRIA